MKKALLLVFALIISVAFVTTVFAAADKPADKPAATDKPEVKVEKKVEKKAVKPVAKTKKFKGEFVSADAAAKTIVVKGETEMTFDVSKIKKMAEFKAGDKVVVVYKEKDDKNWALSVKKDAPAKKKVIKKEKKEDKPADKPAEAPAKK